MGGRLRTGVRGFGGWGGWSDTLGATKLGMQVQRTMFVIAVPDLTKSGLYYQEVLGFTVHEIGDPGWRFFKLDSCTIMAGECPDALNPKTLGDHSYFAYIVVSDIDVYFEKVRRAGADVAKPLRAEPWGMKEFLVRTIDGHRIMFGSEVPKSHLTCPVCGGQMGPEPTYWEGDQCYRCNGRE